MLGCNGAEPQGEESKMTHGRPNKQVFTPYPEPTDSQLQALVETLAWFHQVNLTGVTIKADDDGWLVVLRAEMDGQHMVHFTGGHSWQDALEVLMWEIMHKALNWKTDKYALNK